MKKVKFLGMNVPWFGSEPQAKKETVEASAGHRHHGRAYSISFDGEKNFGEIGPMVEYHLDYAGLRYRSYDAYLTNEIAKTVLDRFSTWVIDKGLKLQLQPAVNVLKSENIELDSEKYNQIVEARFGIWANSKTASFNNMHSLNEISKRAFKAANIGG